MTFSLSRSRRVVTASLVAFAMTIGGVAVPSTINAPAASAQTNPIFRAILQPGSDESQVIASWRTNYNGAEVLEISGPEGTMSFPAKEKKTGQLLYRSNFATATGLKENTEYRYRMGSTAGGWSGWEFFNTGSFGTDWSFITVTDAQIGVDGALAKQTEQWKQTIGSAVADDPNASLIWSLGDQVEGWGAPIAQHDKFFSAPEIRRIPTNALPGNHDTYGGLDNYDEHFINPNQERDIRDFYFERNNVLFIGLDTNASKAADIERHAEHLRRTIANRGAFNDWIIVGMHHAFFSQGNHYTDSDVTALREGLAPVMSELGVDLVLSGHDHIYTRTHLMNGLEPVQPAATPRRGDVLTPGEGEVLYVTTTTAGGGKFYDFKGEDGKKYPNARFETMDPALMHKSTAIWRQDYTEDYLSVDVTGDTLKLTTYNANDPYVIDQVTLNNRDRALPDPRVDGLPTVTETVTETETSGVTTASPTTVTVEPSAEVKTVTSVATSTVNGSAVTFTTEVPTTVPVGEPTTVTEVSTARETVTTEVPTTVVSTVKEPTTVSVGATETVTEVQPGVVTTEATSMVTETVDGSVTTYTTVVPTTVVAEPGEVVTVTETVVTTVPSTVQETVTKTAKPTVDTKPACAGGSASSSKDCEGSSEGDIIAIVVGTFVAIFAALGFGFAVSVKDEDGNLPRWIPAPVRDFLQRIF